MHYTRLTHRHRAAYSGWFSEFENWNGATGAAPALDRRLSFYSMFATPVAPPPAAAAAALLIHAPGQPM